MAKVGALVTATDLQANLQLLQDNCQYNGEGEGPSGCY
jgi:hypothetical protein